MKKLLLILLALVVALPAAAFGETAETVVYGNIYTVDAEQPRAEALAIADGVFVYVGDAAGAEAYIGDGTEVLRYEDGMVLPGFVDAHSHGHSGGAAELFQVTMFDCDTLDEYRDRLAAFVAENEDLDVIAGTGWINSSFDANGPTAAMIDDLTDKPVILNSEDYHSYWLNSAAMDVLGIDADTPDVADGVIARDADGTPTGCFRDGAGVLVADLVPQYTVEQYKEAVLHYQDEVVAYGETMFFEPMVNLDGTENLLEAYTQLDAEGKLRIHVFGGYQVFVDRDPIAGVERAAELMAASRGGMFELTNIKIQLDGVVEGLTAYLSEPYVTEDAPEGYCGEVRYDLETLAAVTQKTNELGLTMHIHAIGDAAVTLALDAYEIAQAATGLDDQRNAITHLQIVQPEDVARMAELGIVAVTNPYWFFREPGYFYELEVPYLGEERAANEYPMKAFFDAGVVVTSASDYPVTIPPRPLDAMQFGVIRQAAGMPETLLGEGERVTIEQMIEATTLNGAFQLRCEDRLGSIAVGKQADLVVLSADITACDPETIAEADVLGTMVGGAWIFDGADVEELPEAAFLPAAVRSAALACPCCAAAATQG